MASKLTLREYSSAFIIMIVVAAGASGFVLGPNGLLPVYGEDENQGKELTEFQNEVEKASPRVEEGEDRVQDIDINSDTFFLSSVRNVWQTVTGSLGALNSLSNFVISTLGLPGWLAQLVWIPVIGIIYEIVSLYRGIRT